MTNFVHTLASLPAPAAGGDSAGSFRPAISFHVFASGLLLIAGTVLSVVAYASIEPMLVGCLALLTVYATLRILPLADGIELRVFFVVFSICWFWAGIAAVFANFLDDVSQNRMDAAYFFEIVTQGEAATIGVLDLLMSTENGGAMIIWRSLYDAFHFLGFEKGRYIGITVNLSMVALASVVGVKMVKAVFGDDFPRIRRFAVLFGSCGMFWLFAAIHIRDAAVLLTISLLTLSWLAYLASPGFKSALRLFAASIAALLLLGLLRTEYVFVPLAMLGAGLMAFAMGSGPSGDRKGSLLLVLLLLLPPGGYLLLSMQSDLMAAMALGRESYADLSAAEGGAGSLGNSLIVNQILPLRLLFGSASLFVLPIPFWIGFNLDSAYNFFKSLNAMFMYAVVPLFALASWRILMDRSRRRPPVLFLLLLVIGFTLSVAYTSLESRHLGGFLVPFLVLAVLPDLSQGRDIRAYHRLLLVFLCLMCLVHVAWLALKGFA